MQYVSLLLEPSAAQKAALAQLLAAQQDSSSPQFRHWLTPAQYADTFGLNPADMAKIVTWLESAGFTVNYQAQARNWIAFSGDAAQIQQTFRTSIHQFDIAGEKHFANAGVPWIPAALAGIVTGIRGLDDFRLKPAHVKGRPVPRAAVRPNYTDTDGSHYLVPDDIAAIYDLSALQGLGYNGATVFPVVVGQSDYFSSDVADFCYAFNLLCPVEPILYGPDPGVTSDYVETELDLELLAAVAPDAYIYYVYSTDVFASAQFAIDKDLGPVISMSYGGCEQENEGVLSFGESLAQEANSFGITWLASSGDSGAAACDFDTSVQATQGLAVSFPASIPEVTAVGGAEFNEGNGNYWTASNGANGGSALSYIPEMGWNDTLFGTGLSGTLAAGGGGVSIFFSAPSWQAGPRFPNRGARGVPDVSMAASADHDGYLTCIQPDCPTYLDVFGGTSASTPVLAGILTILNQYLQFHGLQPNGLGLGLGNINPMLYRLAAASPQVFHDITSGNNVVPCQAGTPDCESGLLGYAAGPGYDLVTGLGSIDANNLVAAWVAFIQPYLSVTLSHLGDFVQGQNGAVYTVTVTNTSTEPSTGTVYVSQQGSFGLNRLSFGGAGWNCNAPVIPTVCMNGTPVPPGGSYPPLNITVNIPLNAPALITNQVTLWGGNSMPLTASDPTTIQPLLVNPLMSKSVPPSGAACTAPPAAGGFLPTDAQAVLWFNLSYADPTDMIDVTWNRPGGFGYAYEWPPPATAGPQCFWNTLNIAGYPAATELGTWDVSVSLNSSPLFTVPFTILSSPSYAISGQVTLAGRGMGGATITLNGPPSSAIITDAPGTYAFAVPAGGPYTLTPSLTAYNFSPPSVTFNSLGANQTVNFTAQCGSVSPGAVYLDSTSQVAPALTVTAWPTCNWSASATDFVTVTSGATGAGDGTVSFSVTANTSGADRAGDLTVAAQTVPVTQRATAQIFADVIPLDYYFDFVDILDQAGITAGCSTQPVDYCPNATTTRGEMAAFLVVAIEHGDNFTYTTAPYFTDVPPGSPCFKFVQKLRDLGITSGCTATTYCPADPVTRAEMAVFIIAARYERTPFTYPPAPYFSDVPPSSPYFPFVQKMAQSGITAGCAGGKYCPNQELSRGQMAVFIVTGLLNELLPAGTPWIASAAPNTANRGQFVTVTLTGVNTHFAQGATQVVVPTGITASNITVLSGTSLTVQLAVDQSAVPDQTSIVITTATEEAVLPNGFLVQ